MTSYADVHRAIARKLKTEIPGINISSKDIKEGFDRPSFFIEIDDAKASDFMREALEREITARIYYFPRDINKSKLEILDMKDSLDNAFISGMLQLADGTNIEVQEIEHEVVDKVLQSNFDIMISEDYETQDDIPAIEDIEIEI